VTAEQNNERTKYLKTITNTIYPAFALFAFAYFALSPQAGAQNCNQGCNLDSDSTFLGTNALAINGGHDNTAVGSNVLPHYFDTAGDNTGVGSHALQNLSDGFGNTALGSHALNSAGSPGTPFAVSNTATGAFALDNNTTGSNNIAVGYMAGHNLTTGSNNIDIGALGGAGETNTIRIGKQGIQTKAFIQGIRCCATVANGVGVIVGTTGQLGTVQSSKRFKEAIKPMDKASEAILALKPVTFRYKKELDPEGIPQFGLVAEEVENVNPALVARDEQGNPYSVRYEAVNAMLLNEFLKEHKAFVEEKRKVQALEANAARQQKQIEALTAGLQKVSAQVELHQRAPQTVVNNR
jgi:hypothetical protein